MMRRWAKVSMAIALACGGGALAERNALAQVGCSTEEQQLILLYVQNVAGAALVGDMQAAMLLGQELENALSPTCTAALAQSQAYAPAPAYPGRLPQSPPSVYGHGGGTYSVPGVGACGPGGCIPY